MISGVPSALNSMLQLGELDVSPSSSFEYARHWQDYLLLPGHSISSFGKVQSVLLFSPVEMSQLNGQQIAITGESATSINLLRLILREFHELDDVQDNVPEIPVEAVIEQGRPALLIGDRALRLAAKRPYGMKIIDLGEIWHQQTGLPFVFALWMIRKEALENHSGALSRLSGQLNQSYRQVMQDPWPIAEKQTALTGLSAQQIVAYWQSINYRLDDNHLEGMRLFFSLCVKHNLLAEIPSTDFFRSSITDV
jgi:chorismate dehydratase